jgi:DNA replication protein DnaC
MRDSTKISGVFGEVMAHIAKARALTDIEACPVHGGANAGMNEGRARSQNGLHCRSCAAERLTAGPVVRDDWNRTAAMARCDETFPRRFRDAVPELAEVIDWVEAVREDIAIAPSLLLFGPTGTGKTHAAYAALRAVALVHPTIRWAVTTFPDFAASLRPRQGVDTEAEMDRIRNADLLLLDDIGTAKGSEWVEEITYRLINGRYEAMKPSIFTTNLTIEELKLALGDRVAGRLNETCTQVLLGGRDWRRDQVAA